VKGFAAFARKEAVEIVRTWRIWVLPGILLFFAVSGPILAKFTPQIVAAAGGSQLAGLKIPPPTYIDAYAQWTKNLTQIALFAIIIIYGGLVSAERKAGTAILVLTKPVSRGAFVVAKVVVHAAFLAIVVIAGTLITWGETALIFSKAPAGPIWAGAMAWLVFGVLFLAIMTLLSALLDSQAGAAGIGLGIFAGMSILGLLKPLARYSPVGLVGQPAMLAAGQGSAILWPVVSSIALAAVLVAAAAWTFQMKEL
jgi:ABC-2 type transport system permease protein